MTTNLRGRQLFAAAGIRRWRFLNARTKEEAWRKRRSRLKTKAEEAAYDAKYPRPPRGELEPSCLLPLYNDQQSTLKWAPRDALEPPCASLAEWRARGFHQYELLLSLIGSDDTQVRQQNSFVQKGYSYVHMSFDRLVDVLRRLHHEDRLFCYIIPADVPVHMYFDLDGDVAKFPHLPGREEECLNEFMAELSALFRELFGRPLDTTGMLLLQATTAAKVSWHLHFPAEAFRSVAHLKAFVLRLNERILNKPETSLLRSRDGDSLLDPAPYMRNQNFRLPYCRKPGPGRLPLVPCDFRLDAATGRLQLAPQQPDAAVIDEEVLWRCHPALAQPAAGYTYLELPEGARRKRKQPHATADDDGDGPLTTQNRARKLARVLDDDTVKGCPRDAQRHEQLPPHARPETARALTHDEQQLVLDVLRPHLGPAVALDQASWFVSDRTHQTEVAGMCTSGSAVCLSKSRPDAPHIHASNRTTFSLGASGLDVMCFCDKHHRQLRFAETSALQQLLSQPIAPVAVAVDRTEGIDENSERKRALVHFLQQQVRDLAGSPWLLPERQRRELTARELVSLNKMAREMRETTDIDACVARHKVRCAVMRGAQPDTWASEIHVNRRHLDLQQDGLLQQLLRHPHIAIQSGMGTNKTGVILAFLHLLTQLHPGSRVLFLSNRISFARTVHARAREEDESLAGVGAHAMGFRSYTEEEFSLPDTRGQEELAPHQQTRRRKANQALLQTARLIISPQSLSRLFQDCEAGQTPSYDVIIADELMEIFQICCSSTLNNRRRTTLEHLTHLMSNAKRIMVMDAEIDDAMALPLLDKLSNGAPFCRYTNDAKTLTRTYQYYGSDSSGHGCWRRALVHSLQAGRKVFLAANSKSEVESIVNDPTIKALGLRVVGLHADSSKEDREAYIFSVANWSKLDLLAISPVISHGVDFSDEHFDELFIFGTDMSTMPCQLFQQALRVRKITTNRVHLFLKADPRRHAHLSCDYTTLKQQLEQELRRYEHDYVVRMGAGAAHTRYAIDRSAWEDGRRVLDSLPNELFLHNERRINHGKLHFRNEMFRLIRETGGEIRDVQPSSLEEVADNGKLADEIREADRERKARELAAIVLAADLDAEAVAVLEYKVRHHELKAGEADALQKAKWKRTYGIELADTQRMVQIANFAERFGAEHRIEQAEVLQRVALATADTLRPALSAGTDPVQYRWADLQLHEHTQSLLTAIGLEAPADAEGTPEAPAVLDGAVQHALEPASILRADTVADATAQAALLEVGTELRACVLHGLEQAPATFMFWWNTIKRKHRWTVQEGELRGADGVPVAGKELHKALLRRAREILNKRYGVSIGSARKYDVTP